VLPNDVASSPDRLAHFEREAKTVASFNHPNIVVLHSIEEIASRRFLTMELVEGRRLANMVTPGGLPLAQVLDLAIPLFDALVAAHEKGVGIEIEVARRLASQGGEFPEEVWGEETVYPWNSDDDDR